MRKNRLMVWLLVLLVFSASSCAGNATQTDRSQSAAAKSSPTSVTSPPSTVGQRVGPDVDLLPPGKAGEAKLSLSGDLFDQGLTGYCWAYSTFYTLRNYYKNVQSSDPSVVAWRDALEQLNSPATFLAFMKVQIPNDQGGHPQDFIDILRQAKGLPAIPWTQGTSNAATYMQQVQLRLRHGIPSTFCSAIHCVMLFGFVTDGTEANAYFIADSFGGYVYKHTSYELLNSFETILTINGSEIGATP